MMMRFLKDNFYDTQSLWFSLISNRNRCAALAHTSNGILIDSNL